MLLRWHVVPSYCLLLIWLSSGTTPLCPSVCTCEPDPRGRKRTTCTRGGLTDPLPIAEIDLDTVVLEITAPVAQPNTLTLSPLFQTFKQLHELHLTNSQVPQIGMHTFWGVPSLRLLDLGHNNLTLLWDHNFRGLLNLAELRLGDNRIERLATGAFRHLSELRVLALERNRLEELGARPFLKLSKLQVLRLGGNPLSELNPEVFKDIMELRVFECRGCGLRRINTQMYHLMPYLTHLDLGDNRIQFLDADEFLELHRLHSLHLDGNQLPVVLEHAFANNGHLRMLSLARNRLAKITSTAFVNLTNLQDLDISYNKLDRLDVISFHPIADRLLKLSLAGNQFSSVVISTVIQVLSNLRELSLADLALGVLPPELIDLNSLVRLNVSGFNLTNFTSDYLPGKLTILDLSRNKLQSLDGPALDYLESLHEVHVTNNTWSCAECHVKEIFARVNHTVFLENVTCAAPAKLRSRKVKTLRVTEITTCFVNNKKTDSEFIVFVRKKLGLIVGAVCVLLFLLVCVGFVVWSCLRRHAITIEVKEKREKEREAIVLDGGTPSAIYASGGGVKAEITFKFPLDLTTSSSGGDRKMSVSTIDEIKKDTQLMHARLPNGTGI